MLRVVLEGWSGTKPKELVKLIRDATGIGVRAAQSQVHRLETGDTLILTMPAQDIIRFLHRAEDLGVRSTGMLVGKVEE
ncbi:hypothetical protein N9917_00160 [Deltaproteobacteria bacterium]|nr:hypothetical protein [Deltaproteobacteria bacterium]